MKILLAEDEKDLNGIITKKLTKEGYSVDSVFDGEDAILYIKYTDYDAIILDIMMPKVDGLGVLKFLRDSGKNTPTLLLTAKGTVEDKVRGLDLGANDYLAKPFSFDELMARIRAMTRTAFGQTSNVLTIADLEMDLNTKMVKRGGKDINLTAKEYTLLKYLLLHKGEIISKEQIESHVWNLDYEGGTNVVEVYIRYLRSKIDDGYDNKLIHTVRGRGYVLKESN